MFKIDFMKMAFAEYSLTETAEIIKDFTQETSEIMEEKVLDFWIEGAPLIKSCDEVLSPKFAENQHNLSAETQQKIKEGLIEAWRIYMKGFMKTARKIFLSDVGGVNKALGKNWSKKSWKAVFKILSVPFEGV
jgi:hypothetical protein